MMAKRLLPLLLLPFLVVAFFSCEMAGTTSQAEVTAIEEVVDYEDVYTDFSNIDLSMEFSPESGRYVGIPNSQARREVKNYLDNWFNEYYGTYYWGPHHKAYYGYIDMGGTAQGTISTDEISTSEALGYGLRLANYHAKLGGGDYYGVLLGLYHTVRDFTYGMQDDLKRLDDYGFDPSYCNWYIPANFNEGIDHVTNDTDRGPATDGDFDIAYGLILGAEYFWEEAASTSHPYYKGQYQQLADNCHELAMDYIRGIAHYYYGTCYVNNELRHYIGIARHSWPEAIPLTRPSDWMPHHLEVFIRYYNEHGPSSGKSFYTGRLQDMLDGTIQLINENHWGNGFFPDFIIFDRYYQDSKWWDDKWGFITEQDWHGSGPGSYRALTTNDPVFADLDETVKPNHLSWNACRVPWRIFEHWTLSNEGSYSDQYQMRAALERIRSQGLKPYYGVSSIGSGYDENWTKVESMNDTAFSAPGALTMQAMWVPNQSAWNYKVSKLRSNYNSLINTFYGMDGNPADPDPDACGYFSDSINAFCLLLMNDLIEDPYP